MFGGASLGRRRQWQLARVALRDVEVFFGRPTSGFSIDVEQPRSAALRGSGFRLGALQAIVDAGFEIVEVSATSEGSIVANLFVSDMSLADMRRLCMEMDWSRMMRFSPWAVLRHQALCTGDELLAFLTDATGGKTFAQLGVDLKVVASNLLTEREFQFSRAAMPDAPLALGRYGLRTLAPRIIDLMLSSNEEAGMALDSGSGATIISVPTSSFDRNMPAATRQHLYDDGYTFTAAALRSM